MKPSVSAIALLIATISTPTIANQWGKIVVDHYECDGEGSSDRILIATELGFTLAEGWQGYGNAHEGDFIIGAFHAYGFTDFCDENGDDAGRLYIEDYMTNEATAREFWWGNNSHSLSNATCS